MQLLKDKLRVVKLGSNSFFQMSSDDLQRQEPETPHSNALRNLLAAVTVVLSGAFLYGYIALKYEKIES